MRSVLLVVACFLALGAGLWIMMQDDAGEADVVDVVADSREETTQAAPALERLDRETEVAGRDAGRQPLSTSAVRGRVLGLDGEPVPAATVQVVPRVETEAESELEEAVRRVMWRSKRVTTATSQKGRFELGGLGAGRFWLDAHDATHSIASPIPIEVASDRIENVTVQLAEGCSLRGVARDEMGNGVPGVTIVLDPEGVERDPVGERRTETDDRGRFLFAGVRCGSEYDLGIVHAEYFLEERPDRIVFEGDRSIELRLRRFGILAGQVLDPSQVPVAEAIVSVDGEEEKADTEGRFRFRLQGRLEEPFHVIAATDDLDLAGELDVPLAPGERREDVILQLERTARVVGQVTSTQGVPLEGAKVMVRKAPPLDPEAEGMLNQLGYAGSKPPTEEEWQEQESGLDGLERERVELVMRGQLEAARNALEQERQRLEDEVQVRRMAEVAALEAERALLEAEQRRREQPQSESQLARAEAERARLQALLAATQGAIDDAVAEMRPGLANRLNAEKRTVTTDSEGRYEILGLQPGHYHIRASDEVHLGQNGPPVELRVGEEVTRDFRLVRGATFSGLVYQSNGELAVEGRVWLIGDERHEASISENGEFVLSRLEGGEYRVFAKSHHQAVAAGEVQLQAGLDYSQQELRLLSETRILGRVSSSSGEPLQGAQLHVASTEGTPFEGRAETDSDGDYAFDGLAAGNYRIQVERYSHGDSGERYLAQSKDLTLAPEEERRLDWELQPGTVLEGRVLYQGKPHQDRVYVMMMYGGSNRAAIANSRTGAFRVEDLPPTKCQLFARTVDYALMARVELEIVPGLGPTELTVDLEPSRQVSGRAYDSQGQPLAGAIIIASTHPGQHGARTTRTNADGTFLVDRLYRGEYQILIDDDPGSMKRFDTAAPPKLLELRSSR